ncbi:Predicted flavoprotein CzcO associated with the cation diffusion facilitator CzcD [Blastococcus aggregatus]|uniref:Predicted flavoprotein CzcO associated with the cation diffusion facilitator CzcD n=1 Tax=Blastococcus aggregatus TaxID=38502 RepID=A0A285V660_9ACTN|nr:alpha/beta hydrolase fold domain-containing protein [Blastococcus aggregatus]SOC49612.1 Predicted flavoprotein CzcO associated with the cation diffusion facilitator CzcD [Blastococcus aggregatus]
MAEEAGRNARQEPQVDVVVVGAGFAGLMLLHRLREAGFSARGFEQASDVGGTWYWNRYPGARCDIPTTDYTFGFDPELEREWTWSEKYATQPEILRYLQFVADRYDLRRDITFDTRVDRAEWDDAAQLWRVHTSGGETVTCRSYVMATGCLSVPKEPEIEGAGRFRGDVHLTSRWPHEGVDFTGKRVAVIGTGSSGIQSIPLIAQQAAELTVFQRTPNFSIPAHNGPAPAARVDQLRADRDAYRESARWSRMGVPGEATELKGVTTPEDVRRQRLESAWEAGELQVITSVFADQGTDPASNEIVAEFIREKIRAVVTDPETAEALSPRDHYFGTKRPCLDTGYFATFNLPHVRLVDLRKTPITTITESGIDTAGESFEVDAIVYATGFDAMTGALVGVDVAGREGVSLQEKWADGPSTYLGLMTAGFPNFFAITGPGSPSVLSNMAVSIEQHVDWVAGCLADLRARGMTTIEPTALAEEGWNRHVADCAAITLHPTANSWYMGANVPGKPRVFYPYIGGVDGYRAAADEVRERNYLGFRLTGPDGEQCTDGVVRRLQPDVAVVLEMMAQLGLPALESLPPAQLREFMDTLNADRPLGPEVGEVRDGVLPGPAGDLAYRLFRPASPGPHPVVLYFHGGGWVIGDHGSDEPLCRDLCARSDVVVVSVDYRHGPEARYPAAAEDAWAALRWVADHAIELGGIPDQLVVAGWSAGANLAAVVAQRAREEGGPALRGQLLLTPVTDSAMATDSFRENAEGYVLTAGVMQYFWDHYCDPAARTEPAASPLRGRLHDLPPAIVVTAEFDPLRDEGIAYAEALRAAGVPVEHVAARGHTHTSLTMVDVVLSGAPVRAEIGARLRALLPEPATV